MTCDISDEELLLVITTESDIINAKKLGKNILKNKLAACINFTEVSSLYWWEERLEETNEIQLLIKTKLNLKSKLLKHIENIHSYNLPEVICIKGSSIKKYFGWLEEVVA